MTKVCTAKNGPATCRYHKIRFATEAAKELYGFLSPAYRAEISEKTIETVIDLTLADVLDDIERSPDLIEWEYNRLVNKIENTINSVIHQPPADLPEKEKYSWNYLPADYLTSCVTTYLKRAFPPETIKMGNIC